MRPFHVLLWWLAAVVLLSQPILAQSAGPGLAGKWECPFEGYTMVLELKPDGSGTLDGSPIRYQAAAGKLTVTEQADQTVNVYSYQLSGGKLLVSGGDLDGTLAFSRTGGAGSGLGSKQRQATATGKASGTAPATRAAKDPLLGSWTGPTGTFFFLENGQGTANGSPITYTKQGNTLTITDSNAGQTASLNYAISGSTLTMTGNGGSVSFTKGGTAAGASTPARRPAGTGSRNQELVGKWCYLTSNYNSLGSSSNTSSTEECVTFNADGTYQYAYESSRTAGSATYYGGTSSQDSDSGTWTYDGGSTLSVVSQSKGPITYTIEKRNHPKNGDPMIFINGRGFVTFYNRPGW